MTFISRAAWGARPPASTGNAIGAHPLGVVVHYSEGNLGSSPDSECDDTVRGIQRYHMDTKGWADIAYSFLVCPHGNIFEGRGTGKGSAANGTTQANLDRYAVCALGGPKDTPTALMLAGIVGAIGLCRKAGAGASDVGHRDLVATACPGTALYAWLKAGMPVNSQAASPFPNLTTTDTEDELMALTLTNPLTKADASVATGLNSTWFYGVASFQLLKELAAKSGVVVDVDESAIAAQVLAGLIGPLKAAVTAAVAAGGSVDQITDTVVARLTTAIQGA